MSDTTCEIHAVANLPGDLQGTRGIKPNVRTYAGYASSGLDHIFGCFFEAQPCLGDDERVEDYPLLFWFNGGPGASSMFGAFSECGPYLIDESGLVTENPYSWNQKAHIMFWDNPVGAGYSYNDENDYVTNEEQVGQRMLRAFLQFFQDERYAKYRNCRLFVTGESYGGKYIPAICNAIRKHNIAVGEDGDAGERINLAGLAIGNPYMDPLLQCKKRIECAFELGFIDTKQHRLLRENVEKMKHALQRERWQEAFDYNQGIKTDLIACGGNVAIYDVRTWDLDLVGPMVEQYFQLDAVKTAMNVGTDRPWECADETGPVTFHLMRDFVTRSSQMSLRPLLEHREGEEAAYRVMLYTGNLDMSCGFAGTERMLQKLKWGPDGGNRDKWRELDREVWASPKSVTKGFVKTHENLTQMVIPGSGHMVPSCQPAVSLEMINTFIYGLDFPTYKTPVRPEYPNMIDG